MSRNFMVRVAGMAVAWSVLSASVAIAQIGEPSATPPPNVIKGVQTAVITSALADGKANEIIDAAGLAAHAVIGGTPKRFWSGALATPQNVVIGARDLAAPELGYNIVVITGGDSQSTVGSVGQFPNTVFVDIGQPRPCVTGDGRPDPSGACAGGSGAIPFNYSNISFSVDEGAYLAGIVAASASPNNRIGIISGLADCDECSAYIEGFTLGAKSVKPAIEIELAYLADDDIVAGFGATTAGKVFAEAFINVYQPDVLFPLAGAGTAGMIEAACDANIAAVGSEIDISANYPELEECVYTSIVKDLGRAVSNSIFDVANDTRARERVYDLNNGGVTATEEWRQVPGLPVDLQPRIDTARQEIQVGLLDTCPTQCPMRERAVAAPSPDAGG